jgi:hypothetical protein
MARSSGIGISLHSSADQAAINGDASLASDGHAIEAYQYSGLVTQMPFVVDTRFGHTLEASVGEGKPFIDQGAIGVSDFEVSGDLASPSSNGAITNLDVFELQQLPLDAFPLLSPFVGHGNYLVGPLPFSVLVPTSELGQSENQQSQSALEHGPPVSLER